MRDKKIRKLVGSGNPRPGIVQIRELTAPFGNSEYRSRLSTRIPSSRSAPGNTLTQNGSGVLAPVGYDMARHPRNTELYQIVEEEPM